MKWNYTLKCGTELREAINSGDCMESLRLLDKAYQELKRAKIIDADDYERYTEDFWLYDEDVTEEDVDFELSNFYDLCDSLRVWIPFPF